MIINDKFFINFDDLGPEISFKELFFHFCSRGVGRSVDDQGLPLGSWTPTLLLNEITLLTDGSDVPDLRTVQLWFQDNSSGISQRNIRYLAHIFGCDDPELTSVIQSAFTTAIVVTRRQRKKPPLKEKLMDNKRLTTSSYTVSSLADYVDSIFTWPNSLTLPIVSWAGLALLWFLTFATGVHDVTYSPAASVNKQIGFSWSLNWIAESLLLLPLIFFITSELLKFWKFEGRVSLNYGSGAISYEISWVRMLNSLWISYWVILAVCFIVIFALQWYGAYARLLLADDPSITGVDWVLVALVHPEITSIPEAIFVSMVAFFYAAIMYCMYLFALVLLYTCACDFYSSCSVAVFSTREDIENHSRLADRIIYDIYSVLIFSIILSTLFKLNSVYIASTGENIFLWLLNDAKYALQLSDNEWTWINNAPKFHVTSFFLLFVALLSSIASAYQIYRTFPVSDINLSYRRLHPRLLLYIFSLAILMISFFTLGKFHGFSLLLVFSVAMSFYSTLYKRSAQT